MDMVAQHEGLEEELAAQSTPLEAQLVDTLLGQMEAQSAKPLTIKQWGDIALEAGIDEDFDDPVLVEKLVRAVEAAHGIKEKS